MLRYTNKSKRNDEESTFAVDFTEKVSGVNIAERNPGSDKWKMASEQRTELILKMTHVSFFENG